MEYAILKDHIQETMVLILMIDIVLWFYDSTTILTFNTILEENLLQEQKS